MARAKIIFGTRKKKDRYFIDDKEVTKKVFDKEFPTKIGDLIASQTPQNTLMQTSKAWPRRSNSRGCHAKQKAEFEAEAANAGCPTEYRLDETGNCSALMQSPAHQRDFLKALGLNNRDGGYGQVTG